MVTDRVVSSRDGLGFKGPLVLCHAIIEAVDCTEIEM
jgi:hypothetical protein